MTSRQFLWGLSNGVSVLAIAGTFWFGAGLGPATWRIGPELWTVFLAILLTSCVATLRAAARLRRRSGFKISEVRQGDARGLAETRKIRVGFGLVTIGESIMIGLVATYCVRVGRQDLVLPSISLVVSLHFAPLGYVFHVRAYYVTALAGALVSFVALVGMSSNQLVFLGSGMALVMWISAWYLVRNADQIAARAVEERWV